VTTPGARRAMERVTAAIKVCLYFPFHNLLRPPPVLLNLDTLHAELRTQYVDQCIRRYPAESA
jgi:hypothetical protein